MTLRHWQTSQPLAAVSQVQQPSALVAIFGNPKAFALYPIRSWRDSLKMLDMVGQSIASCFMGLGGSMNMEG